MTETAVTTLPKLNDPHDFLASGGGEMAERIRSFDWSKTPLGPVEAWSPALRMMVRFLLANRFPLLLWWGPAYVSIYNDPYCPVLGTKHPWALGQPVSECWNEIWHILRPLIDTPFHGGPSTWNDDILLELNRHGFVEETHFTIAYSPVPDETVASGIGGVLATVHEITEKVVGERRVVALRDLGAHVGEAKTAEDACAIAARTLAEHEKDIPFVLLYLIDGDGKRASLAGAAGVGMGEDISPRSVDLCEGQEEGWPLARALQSGAMQVVDRLGERFAAVPRGPWSDPPDQAVVVPIPSNRPHEPAGLMVAGISARLRWDESYRGFFELLTTQVATAVANARAYEEEKRRAEALAELDRAKTAFFSNVSHEFRTPLTLILGPLEDALAETEEPGQRERLEMLHRNALRLQKLVNTLLDFSRIEAGRIQASYDPTDLAELTAELASVFRSAVEKAGLRLSVHCPPLGEPVYVDRDMYEKVVLNLLSNAFKFTLDGEIEVTLRDAGAVVELAVRDTGTGIAEDQLPHVFERFHRIEGVRARTHEGTGIGLALVEELVKLHGGKVSVRSVAGQGSTFTVSIPKGKAHLPADRIGATRGLASTALVAGHYLEEALRWLPDGVTLAAPAGSALMAEARRPAASADRRPRIVWADDNADMRDYVGRLLGGLYDVEALADGEAALAAACRHPPDLVLADVMMPQLDGFGLLRALRADDRTRTIPVILLSARAGEEARVEGMQAGADDYLTKPFSARELLARVQAHLEMARVRREAAERLRRSEEALLEADRRKDEFLATLAHELRNPLAPIRNSLHVLRLAGSDGRAAARVQEMMERQVNHMVRLVDDLMEVSRITRGKIELRKEPTELAAVVRSAVETSRPLIDAARHELAVSLPPDPLTLDADPVRLAQVIANLLNNAAKYTEEGGRIWLTARREGAEAVVSVRDNGMGIPADLLPKVFDLFTQVDRTYSRAQGGLGIGLTLVRSLVDLHGGSVEARSDGPAQGSEFLVRLPLLVGPPCPGDCGPRNDRPNAIAPCRILVVDDNQDAADSLGMLLKLMGADVTTVHDGPAALEALRTYRPSVLLLDIGMPEMDGYEVARRVRQQPEGRDVTLIALTGWGQEEDRRRSREAGFDHHLVKPVDLGALERLMAALAVKGSAGEPVGELGRGGPA